MKRFEAWAMAQAGEGRQPVFVAFNAAFDWMFINYYFMHYLGHNPFGHAALDIKAFYMGLTGSTWAGTSWRYIDAKYKAGLEEASGQQLSHHALQDAIDQARLFERMMEDLRRSNGKR
jgi:DNA polymerase III epsilon subunit-like protein